MLGESDSNIAIDLRNVGVRVGRDWLVRNINWRVPRGACAAILGPNGSGKSTLARILMGHVWATEGSVSAFGQTFGKANLLELRKGFRLVQPNSLLDIDEDMTTRDVVITGFFGSVNLYDKPTLKMKRRAGELIHSVGLDRVEKHRFNTLSTGERMRCLVARTLAVEPELLILDEPAAGLDMRARELVLSSIEALLKVHPEMTLVIITHHLEELPRATSQVLLLNEGAVAGDGPPGKVLTGPKLSAVYECPVKVKKSGGRYYWYVSHQKAVLR